ncbi:MAG: hypothetical protein NZ533_05255 [Casimicrobiaceae bacterium]|nr:hypothetical protein [Casimicrobiaceae bacterium]MDW8311529.1 hypothetical protein [Burkholderiales bacterium]
MAITGLLIGALAVALSSATGWARVTSFDLEWFDQARDRPIPLRIRVPEGAGLAPVVLVSHDHGGTRASLSVWGERWARAGYLVIHIEHRGAQAAAAERARVEPAPSVRRVRPIGAEQLLGRSDDVRFVLAQLERRDVDALAEVWRARIDPTRIALAGEGVGARLAQALAGERFPGPIPSLAEPRIRAFIGIEPLAQGTRKSWPERYGSIDRPFLSVLGRDTQSPAGVVPSTGGAPIGRRLGFHEAMPPGGKWRVILKGASTDPPPVALDLSVQFLDVYLRGDTDASPAFKRRVAALIEAGHRFERK